MKNNPGTDDLLNKRAFSNATWILTDKQSGEVSEYDYLGMSGIVIDAYKENRNPQNVTIKHLSRVGCEISIIDDRYAESVSYSTILPDYTIDCYDWHYRCQHCGAILDEIREKGQKVLLELSCSGCSW